MYKIKDMPISERPRERLKTMGPSHLSDEELLAIILKTGSKKKSAKILAGQLLAKINGIENIKETNMQILTSINGIGETKALTILAVIEFSKRINNTLRFINDLKINSPEIVFNYYREKIGESKQEQFYCLYLDSQKKLIKEKDLFKGTINKSLVHPREIFKEAFLVSACSIICVHNHPSGHLEPSSCDIEFTNELKKMSSVFGLTLDDHVIITNQSFYSFFLNGKL